MDQILHMRTKGINVLPLNLYTIKESDVDVI